MACSDKNCHLWLLHLGIQRRNGVVKTCRLIWCIHIRNSMACVGGFKTCSDKNCHCMVVAIVYLK